MKAQYKWALAAAAVLLLGFVSLQQTGALWRSEASGGGASLTAGTLDISAGNEGVKQFTLDGMELKNKAPGDSVQKPLPVINSGNIPMTYALNRVEVSGETPLHLRVAVVGSAAECTDTGTPGQALFSGPAGDGSFASHRTVQNQATEFLCLKMTILDGAPSGKDTTATFEFGASSIAS